MIATLCQRRVGVLTLNSRRRTEWAFDPFSGEPGEPVFPGYEPAEPSDLDDVDFPCTDEDDDDSRWDVFLPDEIPFDPLPERGDFWIDAED